MARIKILPEQLANKIAAGEVVQRPESVVKELIENAIDAGADEIELLIRKAGKSLIQVIDNGCGMTEEDAQICVQKHATSKISTLDDLDAIDTLGFRGEALSSIAAVSQFELRTETRDDELGTQIRIDEKDTITLEKGSFPKGTTVIVKNLFYNTPARRNFLKTDATELKHITDTFNRLALSHPAIRFRLTIDSSLSADYKSGALKERIAQIFGKEKPDNLIPLNEQTEYLSLNGFIGKPNLIKKSRGDQYLYLNNRYVNSRQVSHAVFMAYENILEKGDYPFFILFLDIDPGRIDVNVHPSKLEVRFDDDKGIYNFILSVIRKNLAEYDLVPSLAFSTDTDGRDGIRFTNYRSTEAADFSDRPPANPKKSYPKAGYSDEEINELFDSLDDRIDRSAADAENIRMPFDDEPEEKEKRQNETIVKRAEQPVEASTPFIVQLHNKYILSQIKSGLMIIDQHVAHERILYEKALKLLESEMRFSQPLLFPKSVAVDEGTYSVVREMEQHLRSLGFDINLDRKNLLVIEGVPQEMRLGNEEKVLLDIVQEYIDFRREDRSKERHNMAAAYSCKAAIKAGDKLSEEEMRLLIDQLFATSMPYVCPHGRPIVVKISLDEFDRRFGRTS